MKNNWLLTALLAIVMTIIFYRLHLTTTTQLAEINLGVSSVRAEMQEVLVSQDLMIILMLQTEECHEIK